MSSRAASLGRLQKIMWNIVAGVLVLVACFLVRSESQTCDDQIGCIASELNSSKLIAS